MRRLSAFAFAVVVALGCARAASAHAVLVASRPAEGAVVQASPRTVLLRFDEPVETAFGSVRVYDGDARRVDSGAIARPARNAIAVRVDRRLPRGTYTVTWRVISADSHPVHGAFVFSVGAPGAHPNGVAARVLDAGIPLQIHLLLHAARFADFILLLLATGGMVAIAFVLRRRDAVLLGCVAACAAALAVAAFAGIVAEGAAGGGFGVSSALRPSVVAAILTTHFGRVWLAQALLATLLALAATAAVRWRRAGYVAVACAAGLIVTPSLAGHASVAGRLAFAADVAHVAAAAVWIGGLAFVLFALARARDARWETAAEVVPRFSALAFGSVGVLLAAGAVSGYVDVHAWRGLTETTYGRLLLAKVGLVVPLLALGGLLNRVVVPQLRADASSPRVRRRFLQAVGAELALVMLVVAVTTVLIATPTARTQLAPTGPYAATTAVGPLEANVLVDPDTAGPNSIHLYLLGPSGLPAPVAAVRILASLPGARIGPLRLDARPAGPGHVVVSAADLPIAGRWQLELEVRRGAFTELVRTISIPIRKEH
jgi:copper transport protein